MNKDDIKIAISELQIEADECGYIKLDRIAQARILRALEALSRVEERPDTNDCNVSIQALKNLIEAQTQMPEFEQSAALECIRIIDESTKQTPPDVEALSNDVLDEILHDLGIPNPKERKQVFRDFYKALVNKGYLGQAWQEGWKLVPVKPTKGMQLAGLQATVNLILYQIKQAEDAPDLDCFKSCLTIANGNQSDEIYKAFIEAAPKPPAEGGE